MVHQIAEQWQIDLVGMSKPSRNNNGFKIIMVVIDTLFNYARLEKTYIAMKNTL